MLITNSVLEGEIVVAHLVETYAKMRKQGKLNQPLTRQRLYRLFFLIQLDYYQQTTNYLVKDRFVHFKLGPIVEKIYQDYNLYLSYEEILEPTKIYVYKSGRFKETYALDSQPKLDQWLENRMKNIFLKYDTLDGFELTDITFDLIEKEERGTELTVKDYFYAKGSVL